MLVIGIDPGVKGAICALDFQTGSIEFRPTPGPLVNLPDLYEWIVSREPRIIGIEDVSSVPGTSAKSNFQFGRNLGAVETLAILSRQGMDRIRPKDWQKEIGISIPRSTKGAARKRAIKQAVGEKCLQLYPGAEIFGPKGGLLDGRADSLMIAHCMGLKYGAR
jgi:hypothetical protein